MILFDKKNEYFYSTLINDDLYFSAFCTRKQGDGRKKQPIEYFLEKNTIAFSTIVRLDQIHSDHIVWVKETEKEAQADAMITDVVSRVLTVHTADCLPIIFVDKRRGVIGISHQGWRGTLAMLGAKMITAFIKKGSKKEDILVSLGPAIGMCCYSIDQKRYLLFSKKFAQHISAISVKRNGNYHISIGMLNYLLLMDSGIKKEHIDFFPFCTYCDRNRFFSFRRDGEKREGDMISCIMRT